MRRVKHLVRHGKLSQTEKRALWGLATERELEGTSIRLTLDAQSAMLDYLTNTLGFHGLGDYVLFDRDDIENATYCCMEVGQAGYPAGGTRWKERYFEDVCKSCGCYDNLKSPLVISHETYVSRKATVTSHWIYDVVYYNVERWNQIIADNLIASCASSLPNGKLQTTWRILSHEARVDVETRFECEGTTCELCGRVKWACCEPGYGPQVISTPTSDIAFTNQWFGDGNLAHRRIIVSQAFVKAALDQGLTGVSFRPCAVRS